jgi:hypothetical protein
MTIVNPSYDRFNLARILGVLASVGLVSLVLSGCADPTYVTRPVQTPPPPPPSLKIIFYPSKGQSPAQQDRDRYECYRWAVKQTGFDPGQAQLAPHQRIEVVPATPPGANVVAGAMTGAVVGSIVTAPQNNASGMVFGAITGAMIGAAKDQAEQEQAAQIQQQYNANSYARVERQARDYRRAMTACLEGRGYTVSY